MMTMRNSSYLRPFSAMYITVVPDGEYVNVTQIGWFLCGRIIRCEFR